MITALDHIVILVDDLQEAARDYEALGFVVSPGGEHADGASHNVLISFADGSYLELIAFRRPAPEHRWWHHSTVGEGLIEFALLPGAIEADVAAARARSLELVGPHPGGRERPDGVRIDWLSAFPAAPELPFLCADVTPRELRVPFGEAWRHYNSVSGIYRVTVAVRDLEASAQRYSALLGQAPLVEPGRRLFKLGSTYLALQAPGHELPESAVVEAQLARRGEGIAAVALRRDYLSTVPRVLDAELTHGARLTIS
jgi:catechol 2,3-dioxygenase-like lactoylglutathione lyase family enzyme